MILEKNDHAQDFLTFRTECSMFKGFFLHRHVFTGSVQRALWPLSQGQSGRRTWRCHLAGDPSSGSDTHNSTNQRKIKTIPDDAEVDNRTSKQFVCIRVGARHPPVPPSIPHPVQAEAGSCCHL